MKKAVTWLLVAAMAVGSLAGCSGGGSTGSTVATQAAQAEAAPEAADSGSGESGEAAAPAGSYEVTEPITIQWWHALEEQYSDLVDRVVTEYNESQDLVTVEAVYMGSYSDTNEALVAANAAGTGLPGVTVANTPYVADYGSSGLAENLTPYIEGTGFDIGDFGLGLVKATSYEDRQVGLPFLISTQVMYYNKDMADELGVTIPETFSGMDEFLETVSIVNGAETERYGTIIPGWDQWYFETFFLNNGVSIINDDQVTTDLGSEASIELVSKFKEWCDKGYIYWAVGQDASSIMRQNFIDGKAFSVIHTSSLYNTYVDKCDFEVGMAWVPGSESAKNSEIGGCWLLIPSKNDQAVKNAAWDFLQYLVSKDINMTWAEETGYMPTRNSVLTTEEGEAFLEAKPAFQCIFDNLDLINPRIQHRGWSQLATIWMSYMSEIMNEDVDIPSKVDDMVEEIDEVLEDA